MGESLVALSPPTLGNILVLSGLSGVLWSSILTQLGLLRLGWQTQSWLSLLKLPVTKSKAGSPEHPTSGKPRSKVLSPGSG